MLFEKNIRKFFENFFEQMGINESYLWKPGWIGSCWHMKLLIVQQTIYISSADGGDGNSGDFGGRHRLGDNGLFGDLDDRLNLHKMIWLGDYQIILYLTIIRLTISTPKNKTNEANRYVI